MAQRNNVFISFAKYRPSSSPPPSPPADKAVPRHIKLVVPGAGLKRAAAAEVAPATHLLHDLLAIESGLVRLILQFSYPYRETFVPDFKQLMRWKEVYPDRPGYAAVVDQICERMLCLPYGEHRVNLQQFPSLEHLRLESVVGATGRDVRLLCNLTQLDLSRVGSDRRIGDVDMSFLPNLARLDLAHTSCISDAGLRVLTNLTCLDLTENARITDATSAVNTLKSLSLVYNIVFRSDALARLTQLTMLNLTGNATIRDTGLRPLVHLEWLSLAHAPYITGDALHGLTNLTHLELIHNTGVVDAALRPLVKLRVLDLSNNAVITDAGIAPLTQLTSLSLRANSVVTLDGLRPLTRLQRLVLVQNRLAHCVAVTAVVPVGCWIQGRV